MDDPIVASLAITLIGMPLLFLALGFFYLMLSLMTARIKARPLLTTESAGQVVDASEEDGEMLRAAAMAVALARAEAEQGLVLSGLDEATAGEVTSAWWMLHHQRQLALNPNTRRAP